ncbi:MAG: AIR synthase-related protein [Candidatus Berkelbacteria bacterium]|nr:AIR synthase-related protein [Candidatus Berkelbacteria bacterium]
MTTKQRANPQDQAPIKKFLIRQETGVDTTQAVRALFAESGYPNVSVSLDTVYRVQGDFDFKKLRPLLVNPQAGQSCTDITGKRSNQSKKRGVVEIAYRPSVTDPETKSGLQAAQLMGISGVEWIRVSQLYTIYGVDNETAEKVLTSSQLYFNPAVHVVAKGSIYKRSLKPSGKPKPQEYFSLSGLTIEQLLALSEQQRWMAPANQLLKLQWYQDNLQHRPFTDSEIEMPVQWWCDHCLHTTWLALGIFQAMRKAVKEFGPPEYVSVLKGNCGAMYFYEDMVITIKGESHNHPTFRFALGGIETEHGGVHRDIYAMFQGGEILGGSQIMGTAWPGIPAVEYVPGATHSRVIVTQTIAGTRNYNNASGVPILDALWREEEGLVKPWALGVAIGIQPLYSIEEIEPREGNFLYIIGGETGRDGVHGATGSSTGNRASAAVVESTEVQIGMPITQRGPAMLIPKVRDKKLARQFWDSGAGGISCIIGEAAKHCGLSADITGLPVKNTSLTSKEKLLSESQERFGADVPPECAADFEEECRLWEVSFFKIGVFRNDRRLVIRDGDEIVADLDLSFFWDEVPYEELTVEKPKATRVPAISLNYAETYQYNLEDFTTIAGCYNMADQSAAHIQFDKTVGGKTHITPWLSGDVPTDFAALAPMFGKVYGAVLTKAFVPHWGKVDPVGSVRCLMALALSRIVAAGVAIEDSCLCDNFYNPTKTPEQRWYLQQMVLEMIRFGKKTRLPISGKDSSSGYYVDPTGETHYVPHIFVPSILGKMPDIRNAKTKAFANPGDNIYLIRPSCEPNMAGSVALRELIGLDDLGDLCLPWVNDEEELIWLWHKIHELHNCFSSIAAVGEAGAFMQAFYGCQASGLGANLTFSEDDDEAAQWDLLGECPGSFLVSLSGELPVTLAPLGHKVGQVVNSPGLNIQVDTLRPRTSTLLHRKNWPELVQSWRTGFKEVVYP